MRWSKGTIDKFNLLSDLINHKRIRSVKKDDKRKIMEMYFSIIQKNLINGYEVTLPNIGGKMRVVKRKGKQGRTNITKYSVGERSVDMKMEYVIRFENKFMNHYGVEAHMAKPLKEKIRKRRKEGMDYLFVD